jgi:hypothetical protein
MTYKSIATSSTAQERGRRRNVPEQMSKTRGAVLVMRACQEADAIVKERW